MASNAIRARFEEIRIIAAGSITGSYTVIGSVLIEPARQIIVWNLTDALLMFSTNNQIDHFVLPPNSGFISDITSNKTETTGLFLPTGEGVFVKQLGVPTTGSVYFTAMYGANE